jgi:DUF1680 family protein
MARQLRSVLVVAAAALAASAADYPLQPLPLTNVDIQDAFWSPRIEANRTVSLPHCFRKSQEGRGFDNPRLIEAAAYTLAKHPDAQLEAYVDGLIDREVASVDGRLATNPIRTSGYFFEAAVAYYHATGKTKMLDAAVRAMDAIGANYGPGLKTYIAGHEGLEIGLLSMFREFATPRYMKLAQFFLDERGKDDYPRTGEYAIDRTYDQDHMPVIRQAEAVGHCVRATYLYIPLTDIAAYSGRPEYSNADDHIWEDAVYRKTYVTGSIGSIRFHEQFGAPYELPNLSGWNETCASYGNFVWNHNMALLHKDARYADLMERILYNGFLDGVSQKGDRFFYQNPLMSYGNYDRFDWIDTPCCPPNVVRLIASLGSYIYARGGDDLYVNLFVGSKARVDTGAGRVTLRQETRYPWDGNVKLHVDPEKPASFAVNVRIPGWTGSQVMAGDLYRFENPTSGRVVIKINGQEQHPPVVNGYAKIIRSWQAGDTVDVELPMPVRRINARPEVKDDAGRVALERGPLVYCAEWPDNGGHALNVIVPANAQLASEFRSDLMGGMQVITGNVQALERGAAGATRIAAHKLVAVPYFAWANRGIGEMQVWLPETAPRARLNPVELPPNVSRVTSSGGVEKKWTGYNDQNDDLAAVYDGADPISSADESNLYFRMRPPVGEPAWVEYDFKTPQKISSAETYFADDRRFCRMPASWHVMYKDGDTWKPLQGNYAVAKDQFNRVSFSPVTTSAVRLEVEPKTIHYKSGEIGPPGANFLNRDIDWRELGVIEFRVK